MTSYTKTFKKTEYSVDLNSSSAHADPVSAVQNDPVPAHVQHRARLASVLCS